MKEPKQKKSQEMKPCDAIKLCCHESMVTLKETIAFAEKEEILDVMIDDFFGELFTKKDESFFTLFRPTKGEF